MEFTLFTADHMISVGGNKKEAITVNALCVMSYIRPFWVKLQVHAHSHAYLAQQGVEIKLHSIGHSQTWHYDITARLSCRFPTWWNAHHKNAGFNSFNSFWM